MIRLSDNIEKRFEILKLGNPHEFILIESRQVPRIYARKVEMKIHNDLSEFSPW